MSDVALTVDLDAVRENTATLRRIAGVPLMAVVKSDGYGHGDLAVAAAAREAGAASLGTTDLDSAVRLRFGGIRGPILSWLNRIDVDVEAAAEHGVELAVPSLAHLERMLTGTTVVNGAPLGVHLQLDTGMAREGAMPAEWPRLAERAVEAERAGRIRIDGVMSHLANAEHPEHPANAAAVRKMTDAAAALARLGRPGVTRHLAGTCGATALPASRLDLVRVGAGLVGIDRSGASAGALRGAMTLTAPIVETREVEAGTPVGYGGRWVAPRRTRLATLPIGYADGLPRAAADFGTGSGSASAFAGVLVRGRMRPIAGALSMNHTVIDLGDDDAVAVGETATLIGDGADGAPTASDWALWGGTLEHDVVTSLGARLSRVWVDRAAERAA